MRGDPRLRHAMHLLGADLHLDGNAVRSEQGGVQRLIAVDARNGDVILEAPRHGFVNAVHQPEHAIAHVRVLDNDPKAVHIDHFIERDLLVLHFFVNAVQVLLAPLHGAFDCRFLQRTFEGIGDLLDEFLLVASRALQFPFENLVPIGVERAEA